MESQLESDADDLQGIIEAYLHRHAEFDGDEMTLVNNRPMHIWLYAKCRKYVDPDHPEDDLEDAEVEIAGALMTTRQGYKPAATLETSP